MDAKQCDITGEVYSLQEHDKQEFRVYKNDPEATMDIGPKTYEKLAKLLQPKKSRKGKSQHTDEFKQRQRVLMQKRQQRAKEIMLETNCSWKEAQHEAAKERRKAKYQDEDAYLKKDIKDIPEPGQISKACMGCGNGHNNIGDFCDDCIEQEQIAKRK